MTGSAGVRRATFLCACVALCCALFTSQAGAEELARDAYVERLEKICEPGAKSTQRAMDGVRLDVRKERNAVAAAKFRRGAAIFGGTVKAIGRVPMPAADVGRLARWFVFLDRQEDYMERMATHLRAGRTIKAQRLLARFIHNGNQANNVTLAFEFDYCSFKFSRYG